MRRLLLDAGPAQAFVLHESPTFERVFAAIRSGVIIGIAHQTWGELLAGFELCESRDRNMQSLKRSFQWMRRWPWEPEAVREYGKIASALRRNGRIIGQIDMQVAAMAMSRPKTTLATFDYDFQWVSGLKVEFWTR